MEYTLVAACGKPRREETLVHTRWYDLFMLPFERRGLGRLRRFLVRELHGTVLEIGGGSGANLKHIGGEPIRRYHFTDHRLHPGLILPRTEHFDLTAGEADVMSLPYPDGQFDCVISTLVFCSVPHPERGIDEIFRVLKPGGRFLFMEHIRPDTAFGAALADMVTPLWKRISDGCHLNRRTIELIRRRGFHITRLHPRAIGVFYAGIAAKPRDSGA
jgi:SAM-dependent methyltransferase